MKTIEPLSVSDDDLVATSPTAGRPRRAPRPRRPVGFNTTDIALLLASFAAAISLVWIVFDQLTLLSGSFGFWVSAYVGFLGFYWLAEAATIERQAATDRVFAVVAVSGTALALGLLLAIVAWVGIKGARYVNLGLFTKDMRRFQPADPHLLHDIGIAHAIVGTLEQVGLSVVMGVPTAIITAVFIAEIGGRLGRAIRVVVSAMAGTPAVVAGVFIYAVLIIPGYLGFSGFAGALALAIIVLPWVARTTAEVLRLVPDGLREASAALGAPEWRTVWSVVLPTARSGLITAALLGTAISVGETAPLLFTAFGNVDMNPNPFHNPQAALAFVIYRNIQENLPVLVDLAYGTAFILLGIILVLFVLARILGRQRGAGRNRPAKRPGPSLQGVVT